MWPGSSRPRSGVFSWRATGRCPTSGSTAPGVSGGCPLSDSVACAAPCTAGGTAGPSCFGCTAWLVATRGKPDGVPMSAAIRSWAICLSRVEGALSLPCR